MLLKLKKPLLNLKGEPMNDATGKVAMMNELLADKLCEPGKDNVRKFFHWSLKLWESGEISIDQQDADILKAFIEKAEHWNVLMKGRFLDELSDLKETPLENKLKSK